MKHFKEHKLIFRLLIFPFCLAIGTLFYIYTNTAKATTETLQDSTDKTQTVIANKIQINPSVYTLEKGKQITLNATVLPLNSLIEELQWSSSNKDVATVSQNGTITAQNNGTATITVKISGTSLKADCQITVGTPAQEISLSSATNILNVGEYLTVTTAFTPKQTSNQQVTYSSSNKDVAAVNADGQVQGITAGTAVITARTTDGSLQEAKKTITVLNITEKNSKQVKTPSQVTVVKESDQSLKLSWNAVEQASGYMIYRYRSDKKDYIPLTLIQNPDTCSYIDSNLQSDSVYQYQVLAYVQEQNQIYLGKPSSSVSAKTYTSESETVNANAVTFNKKQIIVLTDNTSSVKGTATTTKKNKKVLSSTVRYSSSNTKIATVNAESGTIKGIAPGTCKIICTMHNGITEEILVTVEDKLLKSQLEIIGHRGTPHKAPENTLASFKQAYEDGYESIEADIWMSDYGDILISHDSNISRMCGVDESIYNISSASRKLYPILSGTNVKKYSTQYLPTLEETVSRAAKWNVKLYLHLKGSTKHVTSARIEQMLQILDKYDMRDKTTVFATDQDVLKLVLKYDIDTGYLIPAASYQEMKDAISYAKKNHINKMFFKYYNDVPLTTDIVDLCHNANMEVGCYVVNKINQAVYLAEIGADYIISDYQLFTNKN